MPDDMLFLIFAISGIIGYGLIGLIEKLFHGPCGRKK